MKRPRTIFGPFALVAMLAIGFALGRFGHREQSMHDAEAQIIGERGAPLTSPQQRLRARVVVPVEGVTRRDLQDTWGDARSEGRSHEGIDILAPLGTRVRAVADGRIVKFFDSERGGITIYQFDSSERFVYCYAHLQARAAGLAEGDLVRQGQVIGSVGMTGNAPVPHLHFEVQRLTSERRWWEADSINPYPLLMSGQPPV
ncbi:MAG: M23 family metallopeptidase [Hyphomonadaceae bacterium]|nr:M23 family metallopeptidase [Hyphomonadaceae bacterium]